MPVSDPDSYPDKRQHWLEVFRTQRITALRPLVTPALLEEHRRNPRGPHSVALQLVLNFVRGPAIPVRGKAFAYQRAPGDFAVGTMSARGAPAEIVEPGPFASEAEAQHAAFLRRLEVHGLYPI